MDFTAFIPRCYHPGLRALGMHDWFKVDRVVAVAGTDPTKRRYRVDSNAVGRAMDTLDGDDLLRLGELLSWAWGNGSRLQVLEVLARMVAGGPKLFRPSVHVCDAMAHVGADIPVRDYRQAYAVVVIELPEEYAAPRGLPRHVAVYHDVAGSRCCTLSGRVDFNSPQAIWCTPMSDDGKTIEQKIGTLAGDEMPELGTEGSARARLADRIAINCNLLLTHYHTRLLPADPMRVAKLATQARSKNPRKAARASKLLAGEFEVVEIDQEITFCEEPTLLEPAESYPAAESRQVRPHWRRGHWRRQPCGAERSEHRLVFIRPVLVKHASFVGDASQTTTVYSMQAAPRQSPKLGAAANGNAMGKVADARCEGSQP